MAEPGSEGDVNDRFPTVLVVDDEPDIRELIAGVLEDDGHGVRTAATAEKAIEEVRRRTPSLVVLDVWLQGSDMDGLSVLKYLKAIDPLLPVIVISGHGNVETAVAAIRRGAYDFIEKPLSLAYQLGRSPASPILTFKPFLNWFDVVRRGRTGVR